MKTHKTMSRSKSRIVKELKAKVKTVCQKLTHLKKLTQVKIIPDYRFIKIFGRYYIAIKEL